MEPWRASVLDVTYATGYYKLDPPSECTILDMLSCSACSIIHYARMPSPQCRCTVVRYVVAVSSFCRYAFDTVRDGSNEVATAFEWLLDECTRRQFEAPLSLESMVLHHVLTGYSRGTQRGPRGAAPPRADCCVKLQRATCNMQHSTSDAPCSIGCKVTSDATSDATRNIGCNATSDATSDAPCSIGCTVQVYSLPTARNRRFKKEVAVLRSTIDAIVAKRLAASGAGAGAGGEHEDILKYMLQANQEDGQHQQKKVTSQGLADNLLTLLFGGFVRSGAFVGAAASARDVGE